MRHKHFNVLKRLASAAFCAVTAIATCVCSFGTDSLNVSAASASTLARSRTYSYTGNYQVYQASEFGAGTYTIEVYGGAGGDSGNFGSGTTSYAGGKGGYVKITLDLSDSDVLYIGCGARGDATGDANFSASNNNGFGSGGGAGNGNRTAAGGGATEVRLNGTSTSNRLAVAGGGGGASHYSNGSGVAGGNAGVYGSGNTSHISGGTSSAYGGGGGGGYLGGSCGSNSSASHGGSNYVNTSRVTTVNANTTYQYAVSGFVVVTRLSDYICKVDPNGGALDGNTDVSTYTMDTSVTRIDSTSAADYALDCSTNKGVTVSGAGAHRVTVNKTGYYYLELFGACGGADASRGGNGGYVKTYAYLTAGQTLYIGNGQAGWTQNGGDACSSASNPTYGGGARAGATGDSGNYSGVGGGATSIALTGRGNYAITSYSSYRNEVLAVAGGGAGGSASSSGQGGSVLYCGSGYSYTVANGASTGLLNGAFGYGSTPGGNDGGGGGGGWIGGKSGLDSAGNSAGGGASFCNTSQGCIPIGLVPDHHPGNGYVRISFMNDMIALNSPVRPGYTFTGYTITSGSGTLSANAYVAGKYTFNYAAGTTYILANWTKNPNYGELYVDANGGSYTDTASDIMHDNGSGLWIVSKANGQTYTLSTPVKYGYDFAGWTVVSSTGGTFSNSTYTFAANASCKVKANWTLHKSNLTVNPNGGHFADGSTSARYYANKGYGTTTLVEIPTRTGYSFMYWLETLGSDGYLESNLWHYATSDAYLKADWDANTYYVVYNANKPSIATNSVTGSQASQTVRYDQTFNLNTNSECAGGTGYSLIGWHFTGWNTKADGTGTNYASAASVKNLTAEQYGTVTLYAQWAQNTYTISYDKNTGNVQSGADASSKTVIKFEDTSIDLIDVHDLFYKTGYHIDSPVAWLFGSTSGTAYPETVTSSSTYLTPIKNAIRTTKSASSTVYANWIENTYTIHFDKNTPTRASSSVQGSMADMTDLLWTRDYTLRSNNYSLVGWTFKGWSLSPTSYDTITPGDFATVQYYNSQVINNKNDTKLSDDDKVVITLYAVWQENRYNIVFDGNNDTGTVTGSTASMPNILYEDFVPLSLNGFNRTSPVNMEYRDGEWRNIESDFLGWNYDVDDEQLVVFENGKTISKLSPTNNSTVYLYAVWNDNPTFDIRTEFPDRYFTVADAQAGVITEEELLSTVTASDREGLRSIELVGYIASDYTGVVGPCVFTQTYKVTDTYGRISYVTISVHILENESVQSATEQSVRGYDSEYYKYSDGEFVNITDGGLADTSRWLTDDTYNAILEYSILDRGAASNIIYSFSSSDLDSIRTDVLTKGIGTNTNISLADVFLRHVETARKVTE